MNKRQKFYLVIGACIGLAIIFQSRILEQATKLRDWSIDILNKDDLWTQYDTKYIVIPKPRDLFVFIDIDLQSDDFSFELSKMAYLHIWRQFIRNMTDLTVYIILNPINFDSTRFEDLKTHLGRFDEELNFLKMPKMNISIEKSDSFRKRYGIDAGQRLVLFTTASQFESIKLDSIADIYLTNALAFINYFSDIANKYFDQFDKDKTETPLVDLRDNYLLGLAESG